MQFTSITFLFFFVAVWVIYWCIAVRNQEFRNGFLLVASYIFYGWWDWRFLSLIIFSSAVDYLVGNGMGATKSVRLRHLLLAVSLIANLGVLTVFKYFNFFIESLATILPGLVEGPQSWTLQNVILPVGISFYTFQTLSYTIDVYRGHMKPTRDLLAFFAYVAFFPQLVAGPIERAQRLLPMFLRREIKFDAQLATDGLRMILWGFFLKAVVADNLSFHVNSIFDHHESMPASVLVLGAVYFGFQIYGDFAGYSLIARGLARLLGFDLMTNFRFPYFARDIAEFWRRWHISLSTWFRDYLYIPLGGSRGSRYQTMINVLIVFLVSGLWHGAKWTFVVWGMIHAILFLPLILMNQNRKNLDATASGSWFPNAREVLGMSFTFMMVTLAWVFFRAESIADAWSYLRNTADPSLFSVPTVGRSGLVWLLALVVLDWLHRKEDIPIRWPALPSSIRWVSYAFLLCVVYYRGYFGEQEFIYFQF